MKDIKDLNIAVQNGIETVTVLLGEALTPKEPKKVHTQGVLDSPLRWLKQRINQIDQKKCNIIVNREKMTIILQVNENDHYDTIIEGKMELHPMFVKFGINTGKYRTTFELAELIKMNRSFFENQKDAMELVTLLRSFRATVDRTVEMDTNPNKGDKKALIAQTVESNLPPLFKICVPIFKGTPKQTIECETYFNPDDLTCTLVSAGANDSQEYMKETFIDRIIEDIIAVAPEVVILEV